MLSRGLCFTRTGMVAVLDQETYVLRSLPLLRKTLSLNKFWFEGRDDIYCYWIDNSELVVDFVSCNVANDSLVQRRTLSPVDAVDAVESKVDEKQRKYVKDIGEANADRKTPLVFIVVPFSMNERLSVEAGNFLNDFHKLVQEETMKRFDVLLWQLRIQFAIVNGLNKLFRGIREAVARKQAEQDFV
ncbi:hypothetical protein P9112_005674 [Eukaryota sp. TZLM1-RC]